MLKNYLNIALRNLHKHKGYTLINISGLAIGLACFALIMLFVRDELSYDRHHKNANHIYRIAVEFQASQGLQRTAQSPPIWTPKLLAEYPEIVNAVRFKPPRQKWMVSYNNRHFSEKGWAFADSAVFEIFDIPLVQGSPKTALTAPYTVVLSQAVAEKYFGDEDPVGKVITLDNQYYFTITGIFENMPSASHFHFDFLAAFVSMNDPQKLYLMNVLETQFPFTYAYLQLQENVSGAEFEKHFPEFIEKHVPAQFRQGGTTVKAFLQPLTDIHLHSKLENEIEPNADIATVYTFLAIAIFVLLIACINFMNLATARSANRAKEVGMRKVVGAFRRHIILQFIGESILLAFIAFLLSMVLVNLALPVFNMLTGKTIAFTDLFDVPFVAGLLAVTLIVGFVAGSYPALFLSSFRPIAVLKGAGVMVGNSGQSGSPILRKGLIIFQFAISMILIAGTGIVYNQMEFVRNKKLGFDKEHVVVIQLTDPSASNRYKAYKNTTLRDPNVINVSASLSAPATLVGLSTMHPAGAASDESWQVQTYFCDYDFTETMGMELAAGRDFSREFGADTLQGFLINETAAKAFGWNDPDDAISKEIQFAGSPRRFQVIGVVRDFHSQSLREKIMPAIIGYNSNIHFFAFVRIRPGNIPQTIATLRENWQQLVPGYTFDYSFLDNDFDKLYKSEDILGKLLGSFSLLTIFIACLGLFGLASFMADQRTKEIGVRKVLGASVKSIVFLLSKEFTKLVAFAFIVAIPVAWFAMEGWLDDFVYRIAITPQTFVLAGILALLIAWLTVSYQSIKASLANPVDALKYE